MNIKNILEYELKKCKNRLNKLQEYKYENIEGRLEISGEKSGFRLFHVTINNNRIKRTYLNKSNKIIAKNLAVKSYINRMRSILNKQIKLLTNFIKNYDQFEIEKCYEKIFSYRKILIDDVVISFQQYLRKWREVPYNGLPFSENDPIIITKKGERVRSKTEKFIADLLYDYGIEYKYECPLILGDKSYYPDFTVLSLYTLKEYYWEHHGLMDDPNYCNRTIRKLANYEKNGIIRGRNFIVTYETSQNPIDMNWVDGLIKRFLL